MNNMKKKFLAVLLSFSLLVGIMPSFTITSHAAVSEVLYEPLTTKHGIFNRYNYQDKDYYLDYAKKSTFYNVANRFDGLSPLNTYNGYTWTYDWRDFAYTYKKGPSGKYEEDYTVYGQLTSMGQLKLNLSATMHNNLHTHTRYWGLQEAQSVVYPYAAVQSGGFRKIINGYEFVSEGTVTKRLGDMQYVDFGNNTRDLSLSLGVGKTFSDCNCKDCSVGNIVVAFADTKDPIVNRAYICDIDGKANDRFKSGAVAFLKVEFNEPIRFADNNKNHGDIQVKVKDKSGNTMTAKLVELKNYSLMFKIENTDISGFSLKTFNVDHIDLTELFGNGKWKLEEIFGSDHNGFAVNKKYDEKGYGYTISESLITDIAGNPMAKPAQNKIALASACFDGEAPYVYSISKTAQMNNGDVKTALGKTDANTNSYLDDSDIIAGVGDKIDYTVNFNEQIKFDGNCFSSNDFLGMKATLNVKDSTGNYVTIDSAKMSQIKKGSDSTENSPPGSYTSVSFSTFTMKEGMNCDDIDGKIKITSVTVSPGSKITDLCDNEYFDLNNSWDTLEKNPYILDVTAPTITTSVEYSDNGYTPITEVKTGGVVTGFYFPISVTDSAGTDALKGYFSWVDRLSVEKSFKYKYAVTADNVTPDPDSPVWQTGTTGQSHSFTQVSTGNYIHISLITDESYLLSSTSLKIEARDYAGNYGTKTFELNYIADTIKPLSVIESTGKSYDTVSQLGTLTATAAISDESGLESVYYMWVSDGSSSPSADSTDWKATGSFEEGATNATVSTDRGEIGIGQAFIGELYVKAVDIYGNVSVTNMGTYTYNLSAPAYKLSYTESRKKEASLGIYGLENNSAVAVMIKKPLTTDTYYVSVVDWDYSNDILNNETIGLQSINDLYSWQTYKVTSTGTGIYDFTFLDNTDYNLLESILGGDYYGEIDITLLTGRADIKTSEFNESMINKEDVGEGTLAYVDTTIGNGAFTYLAGQSASGDLHTILTSAGTDIYPAYAESITLKAAPSLENVYDAAITSSTVLDRVVSNSQNYPLNENLGFNPDDPSTHMLSTLEGVSFNISISNNLLSKWGIEDVDFNNTYVSIYRISDEKGKPDTSQVGNNLYLAPQAVQNITLPAGEYPSGRYKAELTVTSKTSATAYRFTYPKDIFVDSTESSKEFGFAGYYYNIKSGSLSKNNYTYYGPVYNSKDEKEKPFTYTAADSTIYIPVNSGISSEYGPRLYFTADDVPVDTDNDQYGVKAIKAWNVTEGVNANQSKYLSQWYAAKDADDEYSEYSFYLTEYVNEVSDVLSAYDTTDYMKLPLVKNTLNTVAFQVVNANGKASEVRYVYIYPVDERVSGAVSINARGEYMEEGTLTFKPSPGQSMNNVSVYVSHQKPDGTVDQIDITGNYDLLTDSYSHALKEPGVKYYYVYTVDGYGNYTEQPSNTNGYWGWTDSGAPTVVSSSCNNISNGNFTATFIFSEDTISDDKTQTLNVNFNKEYMNALGFSSEADAPGFSLDLPVQRAFGAQTVFVASKSNPYGIYQVDIEPVENDSKQVSVTIYGVIKYDDSKTEGEMVKHTLYATLRDPFGNVSDPGAGTEVEVRNTKPKYEGGSFDKYSHGGSDEYRGFTGNFNTPVILDKSIGTNSPLPYSQVKSHELPIFGDGNYTISFYDIFGTKWTQDTTITDVFKESSLQVSISETGDTTGPVTVTISAAYPDKTRFSIYDFTNDWTTVANRVTSATFEVQANSEMCIMLIDNNDELRLAEKIYITNIITGAPEANINWYYSEFMSNELPNGVTETTKAVTASYTTTREVTPVGGTAASYTFYPGDKTTSYTFEYMDAAGNKGSVTATLPIAIVESQEPDTDVTAPEFQVNMYGKRGGAYSPVGYFSSMSSTNSLDDAIEEAGYVQDYYFDIAIIEDSTYKFILLPGYADTSEVTYSSSTSDAISGVTLSGRTLTVTEATTFTVVIVDKFNNKNSFTMDIGKYLDNTPPTAVVNKEFKGFYIVNSYIKLKDTSNDGADTGKVTLLSPFGLPVLEDTNSQYNGQYNYQFTDNKAITVTFQDIAGNKGSTTISVDSLDMTSPTASIIWSPHYYDSSTGTNGDPSTPPNHITNKDVTAKVNYSKSISSVSASISSDGGNSWTQVVDNTFDDIFSLKTTSDNATVTFHKGGVGIELVATALNGKTATTTLHLDEVINKVTPSIEQVVNYGYNVGFEKGNPYFATITLTPLNTDVYCSESTTPGRIISKGSSISFTVYSKGNYSYHFTDFAGNTIAITVPVDKQVDRTTPEILVNTGDGTITNGKVTVSISLDEEGTLEVAGANKVSVFKDVVSKGEQKQIEISNNGSFEVIAYDLAGNKASTVFTVGSIDRSAPSITFEPLTLDIRQGSDVSALNTLLDYGCIVFDNMSKSNAITVTHDASSVKLTTPGVYTVTYTVMDEAGNTATATRFVRVYPKDELEVILNSKKTENRGTTVLNSKTVSILVTNPLGYEPFTIYLSRGIKSEGQMKTDYTIIQPDTNGSFTVSSSGFYTLYIVTQSRKTFITKIYFE